MSDKAYNRMLMLLMALFFACAFFGIVTSSRESVDITSVVGR